jgi:hypothetical protein
VKLKSCSHSEPHPPSQLLTNRIKSGTQFIAILRPPHKGGKLFKNDDNIPRSLPSGIIHQVNCSFCPASYIGQINRHTSRQLKEHGVPKTFLIQPAIPLSHH